MIDVLGPIAVTLAMTAAAYGCYRLLAKTIRRLTRAALMEAYGDGYSQGVRDGRDEERRGVRYTAPINKEGEYDDS